MIGKFGGRAFQVRGCSLRRGPGPGLCLACKRNSGEGREGTGQVVQDPVGLGEDLGFDHVGGRSHGGLWAEEGSDLTQALRCPLAAAGRTDWGAWVGAKVWGKEGGDSSRPGWPPWRRVGGSG